MKAKTHLSQNKSRGGFTLVEMLVVIGMIAALAGISFPVYKSIQKKVEKQKMDMTYVALGNAIGNFETEYNYLPYIGAAYPTADANYYTLNTVNTFDQFLGILMGIGNTSNFKGIKFFSTSEAEGSAPNHKNGIVDNGDGTVTLYTPWGGGSHGCRLDLNVDGVVRHPFKSAGNNLSVTYCLYNPGPKNVWAAPFDDWITDFPWPE